MARNLAKIRRKLLARRLTKTHPAKKQAGRRVGRDPLSCMPYEYAKLPRGEHQTIRLLELQPGKFDDDIHIKITAPHRLDRSEYWEALSYVWGSEENPATIHVGRKTSDHRMCRTLKVTRNLEEALRYLRHRSDSRTLWIDAICINQADKAEQSAHVAEMGEIYRSASQVIAWLGPAEDDSDQAVNLLEYIASQIEYDWNTNTLSSKEDAQDNQIGNRDAPWTSSRIDERKIKATKSFWGREWFCRVWIRQEIILAKVAILQVGNRTLLWQAFRSAIGCINSKHWSGGPVDIGFGTAFRVCDWYEERPYDLVYLRWRLNYAKCRDPRDYIYGTMSLLYHGIRGALDIQPNYSKPVVEVYQEITLKWLARHQTLDLLTACELAGQDLVMMEGKRLPSWVPDWSSPTSTNNLPRLTTHGTFTFRSNAYTVGLPGQDSHDILRVAGVECATVSDVFVLDFHDHDAYLDSIRTTWHEIRTILAGKPPYLREEPLFDAFCRSLMFNKFAESFIPVYTGYLQFTIFRDYVRSVVDGTMSRSNLSLIEGLYVNTYRGSLLILSNRAIGIGPLSAQPGDLVCFLLGSSFPTVLRPVHAQPGKYYLVGPCYVDGLMAGEPLLGPLPERFQFKKLQSDSYRISLVEQPEWTSDPKFALIDRKDPRLEKLGVDLSTYNRAFEEGGGWGGTVDANREHFRRIGVNLRDFDII
ncbi:heterokaryon incompatibility protein-domain-containing protein [Xylaria arbuscula]|nr:heterokaryon incompatibility protein-domain-containing protein [Xylaria arbuscula]